jgi:hypothetical protein
MGFIFWFIVVIIAEIISRVGMCDYAQEYMDENQLFYSSIKER